MKPAFFLYSLALFAGLGPSFGQCIPAGPNSGTVATSILGTSSWNNAGQTAASDNSYATYARTCSSAPMCGITPGSVPELEVTNFGFNIPATAVVCGITVEIEKRSSFMTSGAPPIPPPTISNDIVRLLKAGTPVANKTSLAWPGADAYSMYGNSSDLWSTTWNPSDINAINFGIRLSPSGFTSLATNGTLTAMVDHVRITVYYDVSAPIQLLTFHGVKKDGIDYLYWTALKNEEHTSFILQYSKDRVSWTCIDTISEASYTSSGIMHYQRSLAAQGGNYYRLIGIDEDGKQQYYNTLWLDHLQDAAPLVWPNPANRALFILAEANESSIEYHLKAGTGNEVLTGRCDGRTPCQLDLEPLAEGLYYLTIIQDGNITIHKILKADF